MLGQKGFTLIELTLTTAIIGILSAVAIPRMTTQIRAAREATTKSNLAAMRGTIAQYYAEYGTFPTDNLQSLITNGYLREIPLKSTPPYHPDGNYVECVTDATVGASHGDWAYWCTPGDPKQGTLLVNCTHLDLHGRQWNTY